MLAPRFGVGCLLLSRLGLFCWKEGESGTTTDIHSCGQRYGRRALAVTFFFSLYDTPYTALPPLLYSPGGVQNPSY